MLFLLSQYSVYVMPSISCNQQKVSPTVCQLLTRMSRSKQSGGGSDCLPHGLLPMAIPCRKQRQCLICSGFLLVLGVLVFTEAPSGVVYYPPPRHAGKTVLCKTNQAAVIMWFNSLHGRLDPTIFNITRVSDTASAMYLTAKFIQSNPTIGGYLAVGDLHCAASGVNSSKFNFKEGRMIFYEFVSRLSTVLRYLSCICSLQVSNHVFDLY